MPAFGAELDAGSRSAVIAQLRKLSNRSVQPTTESHALEIRVDNARLLGAEGDSDNWLMYGRDYCNGRYSPLSQMNRETARNLHRAGSPWSGVAGGLDATVLVIDGVISFSTAWNHVLAIDGRNGAELWRYPMHPRAVRICKQAQGWGISLILHTATAQASNIPLKWANPTRFDDVTHAFPELKIVMAHLGHPSHKECFVTARKHSNVCAELSGNSYRPWFFYQPLLFALTWGQT